MNLNELIKKNSKVIGGLIITALVIYAIYFIVTKYSEGMDDSDAELQMTDYIEGEETNVINNDPTMDLSGHNVYPSSDNLTGTKIDFKTGGADVLPLDLLPRSQVAGEFDSLDSGMTELSARNYLVAGTSFGIDTQGSTNKIPNLDIRSSPPVKFDLNTTPWGQSTVGPNLYERKFEIGV